MLRRGFLALALIAVAAAVLYWTASNRTGAPRIADDQSSVVNEATPAVRDNVLADATPLKTAPASLSIQGQVVDAETGSPVREFGVEMINRNEIASGTRPRVASFKSPRGLFQFSGLTPGTWWLTAQASGYQRFELHALTPSAQQTSPLILPLRRGYTVLGRIHDMGSGLGIASASIRFREAHLGRFDGNWRGRPQVLSAADGSFRLDALPLGNIILEIHAQEYAYREVAMTIGEENTPIEVALSRGGRISGYLAASDGLTRVSGMVGLWSIDQDFGGGHRTNETGEFSFPNLTPGRYRLSAQWEDAQVARDIEVADGQELDNVVLAFQEGASIRGTVRGLKPQDLSRVTIDIRGERDLGNSFGSVRVNEQGGYRIQGLKPGTAIVRVALGTHRSMTRVIDVPANGEAILDFEFSAGVRLSGQVRRAGRPAGGILVSASPSASQGMDDYLAFTANDGTYEIENLSPQEYAIAVGPRGRKVTVTTDMVLDWDLPPQITGVVTEGNGAPVVGAQIQVTTPESARPLLAGIRTDHLGNFSITSIDADHLIVTVYKPGYALLREQISREKSGSPISLRLERDPGVAVRVIAPSTQSTSTVVHVTEMHMDRAITALPISTNAEGVILIPSALTGATLMFQVADYSSVTEEYWNGEPFTVQLKRETTAIDRAAANPNKDP